MINKKSVIALLQDKGYSKEAIAGIVGNIAVETGGTYDYTQKQYGGEGYGLFQFDFMKKHYYKWLADKNKTDSASSQIDFFHDTIFGRSQHVIGWANARKMRSVLKQKDAIAISTGLSTLWFRPSKPHLKRRHQETRASLKEMNG